jgi:hypothetical protein
VSAYEPVRKQADELERLFYETLAAADAYHALLERLAGEEEAKPEPNAELVRRFRHQQREVDELRTSMEDAPLEALLRIIDRILMIKHTEEGRFV